ncbi:MAG: hypothetical protein WC620_11245 [Methanoregula sp.]|jgi:hypothetical protein
MKDTNVIPETADFDPLIGSGGLLEEPEIMVPAKSPSGLPECDPEISGPSFPTEISKVHAAPHPLPSETPPGKSICGITDSPDKKVIHFAEQKHPVAHEPRPLTARTLDNKPASPEALIPCAIGSGTDTSSRGSPHRVGRSQENKGTAIKGKTGPDKDTAPLTGSFISRIISTILGIFKRQEK